MAGRLGWLSERLLPNRIATQIAVVVVISVMALHAAVYIAFTLVQRGGPLEHPAETTGRVAAFAQLLDATPPGERPALVQRMAAAFRGQALTYPAPEPNAAAFNPDPRVHHLRRLLRGTLSVSDPEAGDAPDHVRISIGLTDRTIMAVSLPLDRPPGPPGMGGAIMGTAVFLLLILGLLGTWTTFFLLRPLRAMETAVEAYGSSSEAPSPLPEKGPKEIRTVAKAINSMQDRITRLLNDRTRTLAAVGHDLRTPITRLRLRTEMLDDSAEKTRMIADLEHMDTLIQSALSHLRDGRSGEKPATLDLHSLLQTVADRYQDVGKPVSMAETGRIAVHGRGLDLERAITNVVDNALKYGEEAAIGLFRIGDLAVIEIADNGPGIPVDQREAMLQPFVRGDEARTMNDADGFGLGLSITRTIVEAHGGTLSFADRKPRGFIVRFTLPVASA